MIIDSSNSISVVVDTVLILIVTLFLAIITEITEITSPFYTIPVIQETVIGTPGRLYFWIKCVIVIIITTRSGVFI